MNLGIVAPSNTNPYATALLSGLIADGFQPTCVVCAEGSRTVTVARYLARHGFSATVRRIFREPNLGGLAPDAVRNRLADYASGRNLKDWNTPLSRTCRRHGIMYVSAHSINSSRAIQQIQSCKLDVLLNTGGEMFKPDTIQRTGARILNAHMGRLPEFRGMNVLEWSLLNDQQPGVTLHLIDEGVDTGQTLLFKPISIQPGDQLADLRAKAIQTSVDLMIQGVSMLSAPPEHSRRDSQSGGKQYFVMHPTLRALVEKKIQAQTA